MKLSYILSFHLLLHLLLLLSPSSLHLELSTSETDHNVSVCHSLCTCTIRPSDAVMRDYFLTVQPAVWPFLRISEGKNMILPPWSGNTVDIRCHLHGNHSVSMDALLQTSARLDKALGVVCETGATVEWDVFYSRSSIIILAVTGCGAENSTGFTTLPVPHDVRILTLNRVPPVVVHSVDLTAAERLLVLSVTNCSLESLPVQWSYTSFPKLRILYLVHNALSAYYCQVDAPDLKSLNFDHNNFTAIPLCFFDGVRYTIHLSLRHNQVRSVSNSLKNDSLFYLDLAHNQLSSVQRIESTPMLFGLDISHNHLTSISSDLFSPAPLLEWLDLSSNRLEQLPKDIFSKVFQVEHLNLSHNRLLSFEFDQSPMSLSDAKLDLRYNQLIYPPYADTDYVPPRTTQVLSANNPFTCDCNLRAFLRFLTVQGSMGKRNWYGFKDWHLYPHSVILPYGDAHEMTCRYPASLRGTNISSLSFQEACPLVRDCPSRCSCQLGLGDSQHVSVECSHLQTLTDLPEDVPLVANSPVVLDVSRSGLQRLEHRPYLRLLSELRADHSQLRLVTSGAVEALENVEVLALDHNQLTALPAAMHNVTLGSVSNLSLGSNPWACGCNDLWMAVWLARHAAAISDLSDIRCASTGKEVLLLVPSDVQCEEPSYLPLVVSMSTLLLLICVVAALLIKFRLEVLVFLYTRFKVRPFDMYKYDEAQPAAVDVFVSFSQHNYRWVREELVHYLENEPRPYKLCIHLRDFPVGDPVAESIRWAVDNSRCTMMVLTQEFVRSEWCRYEFRAAHSRLLQDRRAKLLLLRHGPLDTRRLERQLLAYVRTHSYLRTEDKWFWDKLRYALPSPQNWQAGGEGGNQLHLEEGEEGQEEEDMV